MWPNRANRCSKPSTDSYVAESMIFAAELPQQFVGTLQMLLGDARIVLAVKIGDSINNDTPQRTPHGLGNRRIAVVLLHTCGGGIEHAIAALAKHDLTCD